MKEIKEERKRKRNKAEEQDEKSERQREKVGKREITTITKSIKVGKCARVWKAMHRSRKAV